MLDLSDRSKLNSVLALVLIIGSLAVGVSTNLSLHALDRFSVAETVLIVQMGFIAMAILVRHPFLGLSAYLFVGSWKNAPILAELNSFLPTGFIVFSLLVGILLRSRIPKTSVSGFKLLSYPYILILAFALYAIGNSVLISDLIGVTKALRFAFFSIPIVLIISYLFKSADSIWKFLICSLMLGGLFSLLILISGLSSTDSLSSFTGAAGFEENRIMAGRTAGISFVLSISLLLFYRVSRKSTLIALFVAIVSLGALFFAYSRGALFSALLVCILLTYWSQHQNRVVWWFRIVVLLATTGVLALSFNVSLTWISTTRFATLIDVSTLERFESYRTGVDYFFENPIWGIGVGNFTTYSPFYSTVIRTYPHNIVIEVLSETGTVGAILFFLPLLYTLKIGLHSFDRSSDGFLLERYLKVACLASLLFFLVSAMFSGDIQINRYIWLFVFLTWQLQSINNRVVEVQK